MDSVSHERVIAMLGMVEGPSELSRSQILRLAADLLDWTEEGLSELRCEEVGEVVPSGGLQ
jgi:hypothetical protein